MEAEIVVMWPQLRHWKKYEKGSPLETRQGAWPRLTARYSPVKLISDLWPPEL